MTNNVWAYAGSWNDLISGFEKKKPDKIRKPDKGIHIQTAIRFWAVNLI